MSKPIIRIHNTETNEIIDREMTAKELAEHKIIQQKQIEFDQNLKAKADAKAALLDRLGITAEEAQILFS